MKRCTLREQELCVNDVIFEKLMIVYTIALTKVNNIIEELSEKMKNENSYNRENDEGNEICKVRSAIVFNNGNVESVARIYTKI